MKNYKTLFRWATVLASLGFLFMTIMLFVQLVYTGNSYDDVLQTAFSRVFLRWPMWFILMIAFYIPGFAGLFYANNLKKKAYAEAMKID
ncbi:MAG: hypothetical protein JW903_05990 [Clostridia bacterium]|nr:hypothetical protein [Clostridia bacterium]